MLILVINAASLPGFPQRMCDHILRYETLEQDFAALTRAYGYDSSDTALGQVGMKQCEEISPCKLQPQTRIAIFRAYYADFLLLGYSPERY